MNKGNSLF